MPPHEVPYSWALDSRGKRSLAVDLKTPAGREIILRLVRNADVFITNFRSPCASGWVFVTRIWRRSTNG